MGLCLVLAFGEAIIRNKNNFKDGLTATVFIHIA